MADGLQMERAAINRRRPRRMTSMPNFSAVSLASPLATIRLPTPPDVSVSRMPLRAALRLATMSTPAPLIAARTSSSVSASDKIEGEVR